jgi:4-hydroxy-tetrahydrodipicolinate synthase
MITGSLVAIVTPMHEDGSVDLDSLAGLIEHHIEAGTDGIISVGTTGESATLSHDEHQVVIEKTIQCVNGRIPVIAGTGSNSTAEALELTKAAHELGADACLLVVPYYNKPPQEGLYQHFKLIAESVPIPQILYNVPGRTSVDLHNSTAIRLSHIDNIIGIKDATADIERGRKLIEQSPDDFVSYSGQDTAAMDLMLAGAKGTISVTANVAPKLMHEMCTAAVAGNTDLAVELNDKLMPLHEAMFIESNPIPAKWGVSQQGFIQNSLRLPLVPLSDEAQDHVRAAMITTGVL